MVDKIENNSLLGGDDISVDDFSIKRSIRTRTPYVLVGSDFSQQE